jgi:hypothetical protein
MTRIERLFPIFGIAFALIYAPTMNNNWALATYHPRPGVWDWGVAPATNGPAMYWYGFVFTAFLGAVVVTAIAALVPERIMARIPWPTLTWLLPLCAMAYFGWVLTPYFTK